MECMNCAAVLAVLLMFMLPLAYILWDIFQVVLVSRMLKFILLPFACVRFILYYCPPYEIGGEGLWSQSSAHQKPLI